MFFQHHLTLLPIVVYMGGLRPKVVHTYIHILYLNTVKTSVTELKIKTDLHVCHVGVRGGHKAFDLIIKLFIRSEGSDIVWKVIPQLCPTEAETAF